MVLLEILANFRKIAFATYEVSAIAIAEILTNSRKLFLYRIPVIDTFKTTNP